MPVCLVLLDGVLYSPIDEKPKRSADPLALRRVRNLTADPRASILVDHWSEEWSDLWFVELAVVGSVLEPGGAEHAAAVRALRAKYAQYLRQRLGTRPMLRLQPVGIMGRWAARP